MISRVAAFLLVLLGSLPLAAADAQTRRDPPYWASIASGQAMMRAGPGRNYPGTWLYVRRDLPVRVIEIHRSWRKIEDPGGEVGWMLVSLLSDTRTAIVRGEEPSALHEGPDEASPVRYRAEPGVVGRISRCAGGWCHFEVRGRGGFVRTDHIWGVSPGENVR